MIRSFNGKTPRIAESAFISEVAYVIGDVEVGDNCSVYPGAVIRGDFVNIKIGCNCRIEDNSVIHSSGLVEIGDGVIVGHCVVVHCRSIGNNTLIGNNATVLDGAEIGSFCIIAAGCLVTPEMKVPDGSFVTGVPGKIRGKASPKQLVWVQRGPESHAARIKQYKEQGL